MGHVFNSNLIDVKSHVGTCTIFSKVKRFFCYDALTVNSRFAGLSGYVSTAIPDQGVYIDERSPSNKIGGVLLKVCLKKQLRRQIELAILSVLGFRRERTCVSKS